MVVPDASFRHPRPTRRQKGFVSETLALYSGPMSTVFPPRAKGGRPSKGDRHQFRVRLPREYADKVIEYATATDTAYTDVIADLVARHADELDVDAEAAGRLDIDLPHRKSA